MKWHLRVNNHGEYLISNTEGTEIAQAFSEQYAFLLLDALNHPATIMAKYPPQDGREWYCQCARCGSSVYEADEEFSGVCMSSPEWCEANPLPRREHIKRGKVEWFTL